MPSTTQKSLAVPLPGLLLAVACGTADVDQTTRPLEAICLEAAAAPPEAWICGQDRTVECASTAGTAVDFIHVPSSPAASCQGVGLEVSDPGPFPVGEHVISVSAVSANGPSAQLCESRLTVVDTTPPRVSPRTVNLWPPNHRLHRITPEDCVEVEDACDGSGVRVVFTHAASDEPENGLGDGNHAPDIVNLGCDAVELRAERQGGGDGRVYTLGFRAEDRQGNVTSGTCQVAVVHDQRGVAAVRGPDAYRVEVPASSACGGAAPGPNNPPAHEAPPEDTDPGRL